jgi:hypothetical protein
MFDVKTEDDFVSALQHLGLTSSTANEVRETVLILKECFIAQEFRAQLKIELDDLIASVQLKKQDAEQSDPAKRVEVDARDVVIAVKCLLQTLLALETRYLSREKATSCPVLKELLQKRIARMLKFSNALNQAISG